MTCIHNNDCVEVEDFMCNPRYCASFEEEDDN